MFIYTDHFKFIPKLDPEHQFIQIPISKTVYNILTDKFQQQQRFAYCR